MVHVWLFLIGITIAGMNDYDTFALAGPSTFKPEKAAMIVSDFHEAMNTIEKMLSQNLIVYQSQMGSIETQ